MGLLLTSTILSLINKILGVEIKVDVEVEVEDVVWHFLNLHCHEVLRY